MTPLSGTIHAAADTSRGFLPVIAQATSLPAGYFKPNAELPKGERNERFYTYRQLFEGEAEHVFDAAHYPIINNHRNLFAEVANAFGRFLMAFPPEGTSTAMPMLVRALRPALTDYYVHGVGILAAEASAIVHVDPRYLYILDTRDIEERAGPEIAEVRPLSETRVAIRIGNQETTYAFRNGGPSAHYPEGRLGDVVGRRVVEPRTYHTVARNPDDDIFGSSLIRELLPAVSGRTEVMSSYLTQTKIAANILHIQEGVGGPVADLASDEMEGHEAQETIAIAQMLGRAIMNVERMEFVSGDVDSEVYQKLLDEFEQEVWNISGFSPSLAAQFNDRNVLVQSGVAYTKSFIRTAAELNEVIHEFLPVLADVLAAAGAPADVTWVNPLEALDAMQSGPTEPQREGNE